MTKEEFTTGIDEWSNHRLLLYPALEATKHLKLPVLEMGCGNGSTPYLKQYCKDEGLQLCSFDNNKEWAKKFGANYCPDWDFMAWFYKMQYSVVLVDEAPGEHRKVALELFKQFPIHAQIIVVHDSEPVGWNSSDYQVRPIIEKFKYYQDLISKNTGGAWATICSMTIDVTDFKI